MSGLEAKIILYFLHPPLSSHFTATQTRTTPPMKHWELAKTKNGQRVQQSKWPLLRQHPHHGPSPLSPVPLSLLLAAQISCIAFLLIVCMLLKCFSRYSVSILRVAGPL